MGEALAAREPKDRIFFIDLDNIGVEVLALYSLALISNIGLLTAEALIGEPNEKDPTFNNEPSPDNNEVTALDLILSPNYAGAFIAIGR